MDTLTHLVAGGLAPLALTKAPRRKALFVFSLCASQLPDADVFLGFGSTEAFLTIHRGITHSIFVVPIMALCLAALFYGYMCWRKISENKPAYKANKPNKTGKTDEPSKADKQMSKLPLPSFLFLWAMGSLILYMHVFFDCMTLFGTQIFLPFNDVRVSFPALFIIDPLFTLTATALLYFSLRKQTTVHKSKMLAQLALCWLVVYPLCSLGINTVLTHKLNATKTTEGIITLQTEPFTPFVWKYVHNDGATYTLGRFALWSTKAPEKTLTLPQPEPVLYSEFKRKLPLFAYFADFCPTMAVLEEKIVMEQEHESKVISFADVRYIPSPGGLLHAIGRTEANFVLEATIDNRQELTAYRFLQRSGLTNVSWIERIDSTPQ